MVIMGIQRKMQHEAGPGKPISICDWRKEWKRQVPAPAKKMVSQCQLGGPVNRAGIPQEVDPEYTQLVREKLGKALAQHLIEYGNTVYDMLKAASEKCQAGEGRTTAAIPLIESLGLADRLQAIVLKGQELGLDVNNLTEGQFRTIAKARDEEVDSHQQKRTSADANTADAEDTAVIKDTAKEVCSTDDKA